MSTLGHVFPRLDSLPQTLPLEGAVRIEMEEGVPLFRASSTVQKRIEALLVKQKNSGLTEEEEQSWIATKRLMTTSVFLTA